METTIAPSTQTNLSAADAPSKLLRVLIADDSENDAIILLRELRKAGYQPMHQRVSNGPAMKAALARQAWDIVISDYEMPGFGGFEALQLLKESGLDLPFILVSAVVSDETAVAAMKAGANDYMMKRKLARLAPAIERELREAQTRIARKTAEDALRKKEEQMRQTQKMEAVGLLAASVAHDFNNILSAIAGHSEMLLRGLNPDNACRINAEQINKCAQMATTLTRQLLTYSRKQVIAPRILELNAIILNIEPILRRFTSRNIEFATELSTEVGLIYSDSGQIEQLLVNMVVNARDAMLEGGKLTISTSKIRLDEDQVKNPLQVMRGDFVLLSISDSGTGMSEEIKARIFEPFFTTKGPEKGTGLGLATCCEIVKQSNAHINVQSELGKGTTFKIYFPQAQAEPGNPQLVT